jgi:hypothetical protein
MHKKRLAVLLLVIVLLALLEASAFAHGCAMCKTALENSPEGKMLGKSFNYGILFLMGIPYAMFGAAGIVVYRAYRKNSSKTSEK